ncbi:MAG TPA: HAD family hydrolase [Candidatus Avichristensenella intestinipullorum]|uniref:HAD family hydrolase n=1 Tax=Candidatus Avichristensenella intestinipullorum TaxID=2840693 RepID=A0A9D1CIS3_9FIRM|nr:HAD family hydrolase [Candidatus Avichristensenella intestinipullorum]
MEQQLEGLHAKKGFICDMDGVIYHGDRLLPGVPEFVGWLQREKKRFIFLTNSSERAPRELQQKLERMGLDVDESHFYTSALATASFLKHQAPGCSVYVIGEPGLVGALYDAGMTMNDINPDYVVFGETRAYGYEKVERAIRLVLGGAKLIGTNPDLTAPGENGIVPACSALIAPIELATGRKAYYIGKPNPLMMRHAVRRLGTDADDTVIVGDRMDTDVLSGIEAGIDTTLVLSGVTSCKSLEQFSYRPHYILRGVGDIPPKA